LNLALILTPGFRTGQRIWLGYAMSSYSISVVLVAMMLVIMHAAGRVVLYLGTWNSNGLRNDAVPEAGAPKRLRKTQFVFNCVGRPC
jgi:hypothetical protein